MIPAARDGEGPEAPPAHGVARGHGPTPAAERDSAEPSPPSHGPQTPRDAPGEGLGTLTRDIARLVSDLLEVEESEIDFEEELRAYGLGSVDLALLAQSIVRKFALDIPVSTFFSFPSVASCAAGLWTSNEEHFCRYYEEQRRPQPTRSTLVQPLPGPAETPAAVIGVRAQVRDSVASDGSPVAIVGVAGRMPQSSSIEQFWEHLVAGRELITEIPKDRWDWRKHYGDPNGGGNKTRVKWGSFLQEVDRFDNLFFGISPREAQSMDPRQRLLLETVWSAIENAGYSPAELAGTNTGLYVGVGNNDYSQMLRSAGAELTAHASTGLMVNSILSSRISHLLDLRGRRDSRRLLRSTVALHQPVAQFEAGMRGSHRRRRERLWTRAVSSSSIRPGS
jgi:acyl carrier protein